MSVREPSGTIWHDSTDRKAAMRFVTFCAHCLSPLEDDEGECAVCGASMVKDPGVEMTETEYQTAARKACVNCAIPIMTLASVCFACRCKQSASLS